MVHVMHVHFIFFTVFKNLKTSFSEDNMSGHALDIFIEKTTKMVKVIPLNAKNEDQTLRSSKTLQFPIQCNGNYRGPSRSD